MFYGMVFTKLLEKLGHCSHQDGDTPTVPPTGSSRASNSNTLAASSHPVSTHPEILTLSSAPGPQASIPTTLPTTGTPTTPGRSLSVPLQKTSLSQKRWDDAYDSIAESDAKIHDAYCNTLAKALVDIQVKEMRAKRDSNTLSAEPKPLSKEEFENLKTGFAADLRDPTKRQAFRQRFVKDGGEKFAKGWATTAAIGAVA